MKTITLSLALAALAILSTGCACKQKCPLSGKQAALTEPGLPPVAEAPPAPSWGRNLQPY